MSKGLLQDVYAFRPRVERLEGAAARLALDDALARLDARAPVLLDSAGGRPRRASVLAFDPLPPPPPDALQDLRAYAARLALDGAPPPGPFAGGFLGALAYDLGPPGEALSLPPDPWGLPRLVGGLYVDFLVADHDAGALFLVLGERPGDGRPSVAERRARVLDALATELVPARVARAEGPLVRHVPSATHRERIERARALIRRGEIYQANLAQRFSRAVAGDPIALYRRLRAQSPTPWAAYLGFDGGAVLSASPELLLELDTGPDGPRARTRPIKGTAARGETPEDDRRRAEALFASEKDRAELAMIVDLERNDLGRVSRAGGVAVEAFPRLESYAGLHHLVADVVAAPRPGNDAWDVLGALFPGGSVTGAPKLRSMEVIAELEEEGRGFSFGALGFVDLLGRSAWSLLIRTLLWRPRPDVGGTAGEVTYRVGGGITLGSDPVLEDEECLLKGARLARALEEA